MPALGLGRKRRMHVEATGEWHADDDAHPYNTVEYYEPRADLDRLRALLGTLGARAVADETATGYPAPFFEDPAGTRLELIVRPDSV